VKTSSTTFDNCSLPLRKERWSVPLLASAFQESRQRPPREAEACRRKRYGQEVDQPLTGKRGPRSDVCKGRLKTTAGAGRKRRHLVGC